MNDAIPRVVEVPLQKHYRFMYENFLISTQHCLYLLLEKNGETVDVLKFDFALFKYGSPNDEARGGHPLAEYGLGFYGLFEVSNSPWLEELMRRNRVHPRHNDASYSNRKHFIACFKDVMLEVACNAMQEVQLSFDEIAKIVASELENLNQ